MKTIIMPVIYTFLLSLLFSCSLNTSEDNKTRPDFNPSSDLLLLQFDSKTDADDITSIAATGSILKKLGEEETNYLAVAGAYGKQGGLYIPSPELFNLVFQDNWVDVHNQRQEAVDAIYKTVKKTLKNGGNVWVMEAGQSDVSAKWLKLLQNDFASSILKKQIHIVQHSNWNEQETTPTSLQFVKENAAYHRIEDGNHTNNSTAGFHEVNSKFIDTISSNPIHGESWTLAFDIVEQYNGKDGRYLNPMIAQEGGVDFSDVAELTWILQLDQIKDVDDFADWLGIYYTNGI
ncbi:hypothetical protein GCM10007916_14220 [Psychromonas marina]|uniref:Uncharacterized protein n=1 Tax=Psychromonas marina TaxID=88364 RepID=A0ABQ6DZ39_9GAMM|nr:hypothetical protein [Psychromonas marina]GLS90355.1 hypothetical protein GCM10007916_14220 [Psychromonas marina]